jgi:Fur family ferric uptake transcriptional regulator
VTNDELRKVGLKVTVPRIKVFEILACAGGEHLSAEAVYKQLLQNHEDIGLATVYRVLTQFETAGLVIRHHFEGGTSVFELNQGPHHDHVICLDCGHVEEFTDAGIEARQEEVATRLGFRISEHSLTLYCQCNRTACPNRNQRRKG